MDILAHGLWATAAAAGANPRLAKPLRLRWAAFWGVFPDLFAFGPRFVAMAWGVDDTSIHPWDLYRFSHSLAIFAAVFGIVWLIRREPSWVMLGWPLHILIDIPTHTTRFFATPFLWPISSYQFNGISWAQRWFLILNYSALAAVYLYLLVRRLKRRS